MPTATFRFYAELNDFFSGEKGPLFSLSFGEDQTVKHLIEALGVPHTEVALILVDGEPVGFDTLVREGDRVAVYPPFRGLDLGVLSPVRPRPLPQIRFVLDTHLGRLAAYLRMIGFDTLYQNDYADQELARISSQEERILLTRDRGLLKRNLVDHGYWLRQTDPRRQLVEIMRRYDLFDAVAPFYRCMSCNGLLEPVSREEVLHRLPPRTRQYYQHFRRCCACDKLYWDGPHVQRMRQLIDWAMAQRPEKIENHES